MVIVVVGGLVAIVDAAVGMPFTVVPQPTSASDISAATTSRAGTVVIGLGRGIV